VAGTSLFVSRNLGQPGFVYAPVQEDPFATLVLRPVAAIDAGDCSGRNDLRIVGVDGGPDHPGYVRYSPVTSGYAWVVTSRLSGWGGSFLDGGAVASAYGLPAGLYTKWVPCGSGATWIAL